MLMASAIDTTTVAIYLSGAPEETPLHFAFSHPAKYGLIYIFVVKTSITNAR